MPMKLQSASRACSLTSKSGEWSSRIRWGTAPASTTASVFSEESAAKIVRGESSQPLTAAAARRQLETIGESRKHFTANELIVRRACVSHETLACPPHSLRTTSRTRVSHRLNQLLELQTSRVLVFKCWSSFERFHSLECFVLWLSVRLSHRFILHFSCVLVRTAQSSVRLQYSQGWSAVLLAN